MWPYLCLCRWAAQNFFRWSCHVYLSVMNVAAQLIEGMSRLDWMSID